MKPLYTYKLCGLGFLFYAYGEDIVNLCNRWKNASASFDGALLVMELFCGAAC